MADLQLDNAEVVRAVLQQAGLGRTAANMDTATEADVRAIVRSGLRRFYYPTHQGYTYQWRFLESTFAVSAEDKYETGTVEVADGTITLTSGTWPSDITDYYIDVDSHIVFVSSRDSGTEVTTPHTQLAVDSGTSYEAVKYRYSLPSDFGEFLGGVVYQDAGGESRMLINSSEQELRLRYAIGYDLANETTHYAVFGGKIYFWPPPQTEAFIQGVYLANPDDSLPADLTVPGSTVQVEGIYAEAALEAILAAAEAYNDDTAGIHEQRFQAALVAAIMHDRAVGGHYDFSHQTGPDYKGNGPIMQIQFEDL